MSFAVGSAAFRRSCLIGSGRAICRRLTTPQCSSKNRAFSIRRLSDSPTSATSTGVVEQKSPDAIVVHRGLAEIQRHGPGDAVIVLNVGGKEFVTLRSTVASNPVLADCVSRAETNQEFTKGGAVYIDRDATHFPLILNHLRNKLEGLRYGSSHLSKKMKSKSAATHVQLPKDIKQLRDIYVEASFFQIDELEAASCGQNFLVNLMSVVNGRSGNPFDQATNMFQVLRRGLVTVGSFGTVAIGAQQDMSKVKTTLFPAWFPSSSCEKKKANKE